MGRDSSLLSDLKGRGFGRGEGVAEKRREDIPQGLKPKNLHRLFGTTKVVPFRDSCPMKSFFDLCPRKSFFAGRSALGLLCGCLLLFVPILYGQEDSGTTFRIESKLVNLFVNVTDANGSIVGGLNKEDFKITEDGRPQDITIFERQSEMPLDLILAIDTSASTAIDRTREREASKTFIHALMRPQDQMGLIEFATYVSLLVPFTNKVSELDHGLNSLKAGDATALYDTIYLASDTLAPKKGRKVLVLVSDGGDTAKSSTYDVALEHALRGEVMIYSIIDVPIAASAGRDLGGEHALITLAEQTGGKSFYAEGSNLEKAFAKVSDDLRTQYLIGYYPHKQAPGQSFHRVNVSIAHAASDAFNIRYKAGYYSEPPEQPKRRVPME
jgi:Ca-activated chloride channel family protein